MKNKKILSLSMLIILGLIVISVLIAIMFSSSNSSSEKIVKVINSEISESLKTTKNNYEFSESFDSYGYTYDVYESVNDTKEYKTKMSIIHKDSELIAIKIQAELKNAKNYTYTKYALKELKCLNIDDIKYEDYLDKIHISGTKIGEYTVLVNKQGSSEDFSLIKTKYKDDIF